MRVLHVIPSVSAKDGGPSFALRLMAGGLARTGVQVDVATTDADGSDGHLDVSLDEPVEEDGVRFFYFRRQSGFYKVSLPMKRWLAQHIREYDLVHIHALFSYASTAAARQAAESGVPYVIRPLGVLNRWGMMNRRRIIKKLSFRLIEQRILQNAAAIHYTSEQERLEAEAAGVKTTPAMIPLGIDISDFEQLPDPLFFAKKFPQTAGRKVILFLSRIDAKKGLDLLLPAFADVHRQDPAVILVIAGTGDNSFIAERKKQAISLGIEEQILWPGFLVGQDKVDAFAAASIFVLPSYSENFGIAAVEALAAGLPCVLSDQMGIATDVDELDAGLVVPCEVNRLSAALTRLSLDQDLRIQLSKNARHLANSRFSVAAMTGSLLKLYRDITGRAAVTI